MLLKILIPIFVFILAIGVIVVYKFSFSNGNSELHAYCEKLNKIGRHGTDDFISKLDSADQSGSHNLSGCWVLTQTVFNTSNSDKDFIVKTTGSFSNDLNNKLKYLDSELQVREIGMQIADMTLHYCIGEKYKSINKSQNPKTRLLYDYPAYLSLGLFEYQPKNDELILHSKAPSEDSNFETYTFSRDDGKVLNYLNNLKKFDNQFYNLFLKYKKEIEGRNTPLSISAEAQCLFPSQNPYGK